LPAPSPAATASPTSSSVYYEFDNRRRRSPCWKTALQYTERPGQTLREIVRKLGELKDEQGRTPYEFDRRFIFRILAMGHSQFAEYIGARGPNTHVNAACASTAQGVAWPKTGSATAAAAA
jgi:predicted secreted Zn-dependent protease